MVGLARVGDYGHGACRAGHPDVEKGQDKEMMTQFVTGSSDVFFNNMPVALVGTHGVTDCGHNTQAVAGSSSVFVNGVPVHRLGDAGVVTDDGGGDYTTVTFATDNITG